MSTILLAARLNSNTVSAQVWQWMKQREGSIKRNDKVGMHMSVNAEIHGIHKRVHHRTGNYELHDQRKG